MPRPCLGSPDDRRLSEVIRSEVLVPSPAVADAVLEQLCELPTHRPGNAHMFVCPALMTALGASSCGRCLMLCFKAAGTTIWPQSMHEPVTVALLVLFAQQTMAGPRHPIVARSCSSWSVLRPGAECLRKFGKPQDWDSLPGMWHAECYRQGPKGPVPVLPRK
jgi:hypothetical protein